MKTALFTAVLIAMLVGCSDSPDAASESNFKAAIAKNIEEEMEVSYGYKNSCVDLSKMHDQTADTVRADGGVFPNQLVLDVLRKAGLIEDDRSFLLVKRDAIEKYARKRSQATEKEKDLIRFCIGDWSVDKVTNWTVPADQNGKKTTEVSYTVKWRNLSDWAKPFVDQNEVMTDKVTLILTHQGWIASNPHLDLRKSLR